MIALITGTTGIAAATAQLLRERGHTPMLAGLPEYDFTQSSEAERAVRFCLSSQGRIDAVFNVAGASGRRHGDGPLHESTDEGWKYTLEANLGTMFRVSRAVLRLWLERRSPGVILNMSSVLATHPEAAHFATHAYAAAKGAIESLTRSLAAYYAPHGIRINAIAAGLARTPMSERAQSDPAILELMKTRQPLAGDLLEPEEIARAACFLLSDESRYITGQTLIVDAGWSVT